MEVKFCGFLYRGNITYAYESKKTIINRPSIDAKGLKRESSLCFCLMTFYRLR